MAVTGPRVGRVVVTRWIRGRAGGCEARDDTLDEGEKSWVLGLLEACRGVTQRLRAFPRRLIRAIARVSVDGAASTLVPALSD